MELAGIFQDQGIKVVYCGVGKINAAYVTTKHILESKPKHIVNLGTCGSSSFPWGTVVECSQVVQRDMDVTPLGFEHGTTPYEENGGAIELKTYLDNYPKGICGTGDNFETEQSRLECDLVEMEGYAIAKVCRNLNVDVTLLKFVSDGSDHHAPRDWDKNMAAGAEKLFQAYLKLMDIYADKKNY